MIRQPPLLLRWRQAPNSPHIAPGDDPSESVQLIRLRQWAGVNESEPQHRASFRVPAFFATPAYQ